MLRAILWDPLDRVPVIYFFIGLAIILGLIAVADAIVRRRWRTR